MNVTELAAITRYTGPRTHIIAVLCCAVHNWSPQYEHWRMQRAKAWVTKSKARATALLYALGRRGFRSGIVCLLCPLSLHLQQPLTA